MNVSVLLLTYRKHEFLKEILEQISLYQPSKLYISRNPHQGVHELNLTNSVNEILRTHKYTFEVEQIIHERHLNINQSITSAINKSFENEDELIILEDDIIPNQSFFRFCNEMLKKHSNSETIGCINGCNLNAVNIPHSFFYSSLSIPYWGWATWKSKWQLYRGDNFYWNNFKEKIINSFSNNNRQFLESSFSENTLGVNTWDLQWNLSLIANNLKTIISSTNLIKNKGFVATAVTTNYANSIFSNLEVANINYSIELNTEENPTFENHYEQKVVELIKEIYNNSNGTLQQRISS